MRRSLFTVPWMVMSVTGANSDPEARPGYAVKSRRQAMPRCFILKAARHSESRGDRSQGELMLVAHAQEVAHLPVPDELLAWGCGCDRQPRQDSRLVDPAAAGRTRRLSGAERIVDDVLPAVRATSSHIGGRTRQIDVGSIRCLAF